MVEGGGSLAPASCAVPGKEARRVSCAAFFCWKEASLVSCSRLLSQSVEANESSTKEASLFSCVFQVRRCVGIREVIRRQFLLRLSSYLGE